MTDESKQLAVLCDLSAVIIGASGMEDVCDRILGLAVSVLGVTKASIMKFSPEDDMLRIVAARGLSGDVMETARVRVGEGISGKVFRSAKPLLVKDIRTTKFELHKKYHSKSLMSAPVTCFPMSVGGRPVGVINVTDKKDGGTFTEGDLKLLTTIANQTAAYLYLCDLATEVKRAEVYKRELELARDIQQRLLPKHMPDVKGFDIAGACITAEHVGGDYYDFITGGIRPPAVVIADVAGHGVGAAIMMSAFRSAVRAECGTAFLSTALITERLNELLYDDLVGSEQFISMLYVQLMQGAIRFTSAGHWPPLVLHKGGFLALSTEDTLLGINRGAGFHESRIDVEPGDLVVLFTDGLIEAEPRRGPRFGLKRLKNFIKHHEDRSAQEIIDKLCSEFRHFTGSNPIADDMTVVAIRVK